MYSSRTGLILAFHGCDKSIVEKIVSQGKILESSNNDYDWLGHGIYFWENDPQRALEYATRLKNSPLKKHSLKIQDPAVIGAVINLGYCLDLLDYGNLKFVKEGHDFLVEICNMAKVPLPENKGIKESKDILIRNLDCAVIETLHKTREEKKEKPFDSVRGVFWEGDELYPSSGFKEKDHIQICIRNPNCIKGFFLPRELNKSFSKV